MDIRTFSAAKVAIFDESTKGIAIFCITHPLITFYLP